MHPKSLGWLGRVSPNKYVLYIVLFHHHTSPKLLVIIMTLKYMQFNTTYLLEYRKLPSGFLKYHYRCVKCFKNTSTLFMFVKPPYYGQNFFAQCVCTGLDDKYWVFSVINKPTEISIHSVSVCVCVCVRVCMHIFSQMLHQP